jgi:hypothetical protein
MKLGRANTYPGKCCICEGKVPAKCGFLVGSKDSLDEAHRNGTKQWLTLCRSAVCVDVFAGRWTVEDAERRELCEDGTIVMPYDELALPLLQSIAKATRAGTRWTWVASSNPGDRPRVLEIAERLGLVVHPSWLDVRLDPATQALVDQAEGNALFAYQVDGVEWLATRPRGIKLTVRGCLLADDPGLGKQQPIDTKVLTPWGWREIGTLQVDDYVIGSDGLPTRVTGVFPQGVKPSYRVHFGDGSSVEAGPEHLWSVIYYRGGRTKTTRVLTTEQLRTRPKLDSLDLAKTRFYLLMLSAPVRFVSLSTLPVPPYTLGALIANGDLVHSGVLTTGSCDWHEVVTRIQAEDVRVGSISSPVPTVTRAVILDMRAKTLALGLNVLSGEKFIPEVYKQALPKERIALLHGLMDGDGSCSSSGNRLTYHTTSSRLADDVVELVECLGGMANVRTYERSAESKPTDYQVRVRLPASIPPFSIKRKLERYNPATLSHPVRRVGRIEYVRDVESVCISVDAVDQLYVTEHAILTHNTVQVLHMVPKGYGLVVICPANAKPTWQREPAKWLPARFTSVHVCEGGDSFRWPAHPGEIVVANYEITPFTQSQIDTERETLLAKRRGVAPNPQGKTQRERLGRVGLLEDLQRVVAGWSKVVADKSEKGKRLRLFRELALLAGWIKLSARLHLNRRATMRNAKRKPIKAPKIPIIVALDEAHDVSNAKTRRTENAMRLTGFAELTIGMTGTPVDVDPMRLYNLLKVCRCRVWDWDGFLEAFNGSRGEWGGTEFLREPTRPGGTARGAVIVKSGTADRLREVVLRREKHDVVDLPPKIFSEIIVPVTRDLLEQLDELSAEAIDMILAGKIPKFPRMAATRKALELSRIPRMFEEIENYEAQSTPLVVFADHRAPIEAVIGRPGWGVVIGGADTKHRDRVFEGFQHGDLIGVAGTIGSMNTSATLTRGSHELFVGQSLVRARNKQSQDRCHRIGTKGTVNISIMTSDHPFDQHIADLLANKDTFVESVLNERMEYTPGGGLVAETREAWLSRLPENLRARYAREADEQLSRLDRIRTIAGC